MSLGYLYLKDDFCDVELVIYDDQGREGTLKSHRIILASVFPYFRNLFNYEKGEKVRIWMHNLPLFLLLIKSVYEKYTVDLLQMQEFSDSLLMIRMLAYLGIPKQEIQDIVETLDIPKNSIDDYVGLLEDENMEIDPVSILRKARGCSKRLNQWTKDLVFVLEKSELAIFYIGDEEAIKIASREYVNLARISISSDNSCIYGLDYIDDCLFKWEIPSGDFLEVKKLADVAVIKPPISASLGNLMCFMAKSNHDVFLIIMKEWEEIRRIPQEVFRANVSELVLISKGKYIWIYTSTGTSFFWDIEKGEFHSELYIPVASGLLAPLGPGQVVAYTNSFSLHGNEVPKTPSLVAPSRPSTLVANEEVISFLCRHGIFLYFIKTDSLIKVDMEQPTYFIGLNISHIGLESDMLFWSYASMFLFIYKYSPLNRIRKYKLNMDDQFRDVLLAYQT